MEIRGVFFFFFQAEDGIRDIGVTGVQTCALPIYPAALARAARGITAQHDAAVFESLASIDVPALVVVGSEDRDYLGAADVMERRIPGARRVVLDGAGHAANMRSEEHTSELQSRQYLVCRLLLEKKKTKTHMTYST